MTVNNTVCMSVSANAAISVLIVEFILLLASRDQYDMMPAGLYHFETKPRASLRLVSLWGGTKLFFQMRSLRSARGWRWGVKLQREPKGQGLQL